MSDANPDSTEQAPDIGATLNTRAVFDQLADQYMAANGGHAPGKAVHGITRQMLAGFLNRKDVRPDELKAITQEEARQLLYERFWRPIAGDRLPPAVSALLFDVAIQRGTAAAGKLLQRSIIRAAHTRLKIDGNVATQTLKAIAEHGDALSIAQDIFARRSTFAFRIGDGKLFGHKWNVALAQAALLAGRIAVRVAL